MEIAHTIICSHSLPDGTILKYESENTSRIFSFPKKDTVVDQKRALLISRVKRAMESQVAQARYLRLLTIVHQPLANGVLAAIL